MNATKMYWEFYLHQVIYHVSHVVLSFALGEPFRLDGKLLEREREAL